MEQIANTVAADDLCVTPLACASDAPSRSQLSATFYTKVSYAPVD